jgi:hypothetical protein
MKQINQINAEGNSETNRNYHKSVGFMSDNKLYILNKDYIEHMKQGYGSIYLQCHKDFDSKNRAEEFKKEVYAYSELLKLKEQFNYMIASCQDDRYIELIKLGGHYL